MIAFANSELKNYMEGYVKNAIDQVIPNLGICLCDKCQCDIAALALNALPPKYVATRKGQLYTKLDVFEQQFTIDITTEVIKAAKSVAQNPRHSSGELRVKS